jgi:phenylacetate-CoA ligase
MASIWEKVYWRSPIWLQQAAVTVWGIGWRQRRFGGRFRPYVDEFHSRDYWTMDQFREYQDSRLTSVIRAAWRSPYYARIFAQAGMTPDMNPWEILRHAPLLTKEVLRQCPRELCTVSRLPRGTAVHRSSGTTGTPTSVFYSRDFHVQGMALGEARSLNIAGVNYCDRRVMFGVRKVCRFDQNRPPFWRYSLFENMAYASIYHLSDRHLPSYLEFLRRYRPAVIMGYPSALKTVAQYAIEHNDLPAQARCIITTSETVTPEFRSLVEEAWKCRLFDRYGAVESCMFAGQCEHGRYHVSPDWGIMEILDATGQPCDPGVVGAVVCTGLQNELQPLIRYHTGDAARWAIDQHCPCGRQTPILEQIEGRLEDMCCTPNGRQMLRFDTVFKGVASIREAQVVQEQLNRFVIRVVTVQGFGPSDVETLKQNMRLHAGDVDVDVVVVPAIERAASGKFRAVICMLSPEERRLALSGNRAVDNR